MKRALITSAIGLLIQTTVYAQWVPAPGIADQMTPDQRSAKSQQGLDQYKTVRSSDPLENRKNLDEIYALGMPKTAANVVTIRSLLTTRVPAEEQVALARILATLYYPDNPTGMNDAIVKDLRGLARSGHDDVGRAATLAYSRLGYFSDTQELLSTARSRGLLDEDEYMGELAHITPFAPANAQLSFVSEIRRAKNQYGTEVLTYTLQDKDVRKKLTPETKAQTLNLLDESEPNFPLALGQFGYTDAIRFATWLHVRAALESEIKGVRYRDVVMAKLDADRTDPRKIMSFLSSDEGRQLINEVGQRAPFEKMQKRISLYSRQLPQNQGMRDIVDSINGALAALKP